MTIKHVPATERALQFAVIRRWRDNTRDFQVIEYFHSAAEAKQYIRHHPHPPGDYDLEVAKFV